MSIHSASSCKSVQKITDEPTKKKVLYHTKYNEYWGENVKLFTAADMKKKNKPVLSEVERVPPVVENVL